MTATRLTWNDGYDERELMEPSTADVEARISALDGADRSLVTIYRDGAHLAVGGSAPDHLFVYCTFDNLEFWQLVSDGDPAATVSVVAGGQAAPYPADRVTTLPSALDAASTFLEHGVRADGLRWAKD